MAKFYGEVGYAESVDSGDGVWVEEIVEKSYYGDILKPSRKFDEDEKVNSDISVRHTVSIVADAYAGEHFFAIRYVKWAGTLWRVVDVEVQSPRLLLRLGAVYNA